jgi:hypothetical protein
VFDRGGFLLTNQRVIKVDRSMFGGESAIHSINLENLDSIRTTAVKYYFWIVLACLSPLLMGPRDMEPYFGWGCFIIFSVLYFLTRQKAIKLSSGSSAMWLKVTSMAHEKIQEMVFAIEQAKQARLEGLQFAVTAPPAGNTQNRLTELQKLLENDLITQEEFDEKRKSILNDM